MDRSPTARGPSAAAAVAAGNRNRNGDNGGRKPKAKAQGWSSDGRGPRRQGRRAR